MTFGDNQCGTVVSTVPAQRLHLQIGGGLSDVDLLLCGPCIASEQLRQLLYNGQLLYNAPFAFAISRKSRSNSL